MQPLDLFGLRVGILTVALRCGSGTGKRQWICYCDCGEVIVATASSLAHGTPRSCGCARAGMISRSKIRHGHAMGIRTPEYRAWKAMRQRCNDANGKSYRYYGGRGIRVCQRWDSYQAFLADMGKKPDGFTLDRINPNGNYEPSNCRWASWTVQRHNRRKPS